MTTLSSTADPGTRLRLDAGDPVAWTQALVAIPSVNPGIEEGGAGESAIADFIAPHLERWGFAVTRHEPVPGRVSLVARIGDSAEGIALCGHLDTVGVRGMRIPPFEARLEDGRIHGRGSADMKSGVAAILAAAREVALEPAPTGSGGAGSEGPSLAVVLTADEEHASLGLRDLLDQGFIARGVVVTEPTSLALATANKGFAWVTIEARGLAAHGSRPDLGRDAIRQLARLLSRLDALDEAGPGSHPLLGSGSWHAGTIAGGDAPSVYPDRATATIEFRLLPGSDARDIVATVDAEARRIESEHPGVSLRVHAGMERPGADLDPGAPLVEALAAAPRAEGGTPRVEGMSAWVESAWFMEAGIPALCFGPGSIAQAHTNDEWVAVDEIELATRALVRLLRTGFGDGSRWA
jgi:acetylornithine deacetylase